MIANRKKPVKKAAKKAAQAPAKKLKKETGRPATAVKPAKKTKVVVEIRKGKKAAEEVLSPQARAAQTRMKNKRKAERLAAKEAEAKQAAKEAKRAERKAAKTKVVAIDKPKKQAPKKLKRKKPVQMELFDDSAKKLKAAERLQKVVSKKSKKVVAIDDAPIYNDDSQFGRVYARILRFAQKQEGTSVKKIFKGIEARDREGILAKIKAKGVDRDVFRLAKLKSGNYRLTVGAGLN